MPISGTPISGAKNPIIDEIETALAGGSSDKRAKVLMSVTDLFLGGAAKFSDSDAKLFDDVMGHLVDHVERGALAEISARLAPIDNAPVQTIQRLARNDAIGVSGPILATSKQLSDDDLIEIAKTKSQVHLATIARRPVLNQAVTEVLVDHGDNEVANVVATNAGAQFSKLSMAKLVMRADGDDRLASSIFQRRDISPDLFRHLLTQATDEVRAKLFASARPDQKEAVAQILNEVSAGIGRSVHTSRATDARKIVAEFSQDTDLTRTKILEFARLKNTLEMIAALSVLSGVPFEQVDKLVHAAGDFGLVVLCKSISLDWNTAFAVFSTRAPKLPTSSYETLHAQFSELSVSAARHLIRFWQGRQKIARNFSQLPNGGASPAIRA